MERVMLGYATLKVPPVVFGTWQLGGAWGQVREDEARALIRHARSRGVTTFDTAPAYGDAERLLGEALRDDIRHRRDEVVIATKGGLRMTPGGALRDCSRRALREDVEASMHALGVEEIDLYQVHHPDPRTPVEETADALRELVEEGKLRHIGVSNYSVEQMERFDAVLPVRVVQVPYHLFRREVERDVLPFAWAHDIGVLAYGPLAHGLLTGAVSADTAFPVGDWRAESPVFRGEPLRRNLAIVQRLQELARERLGCSLTRLALAWVLHEPAVGCAVLGPQAPEHVDEAIAAAEMELDAELHAEIERIVDSAVTFAPLPRFADVESPGHL